MINEKEQQQEMGWEFTVPGYIVNPSNWLLVILLVIAFFLSYTLFTKITNKSELSVTKQTSVTNTQ